MSYFKPLRRKIGVLTLVMALVYLWDMFGCLSQAMIQPASPIMDFRREAEVDLWYFVIPLTLLSAWLLLSKPKPVKSPTHV